MPPNANPQPDRGAGNPWENAENDARRLAESFEKSPFTLAQAKALVYREMYGFPKDEVVARMNTSESSFDNIFYNARNKAHDLIDITDELQGVKEAILTPEVGGEIGSLIERWDEMLYRCMGCDEVHRLDAQTSFRGRFNSDGLRDAKGRRWWLYAPCPGESSYENSWTTVQSQMLGAATEFHAVIEQRIDGDQHDIVFEVYDGPMKQASLAESVFHMAPTDPDDPTLYEVVEFSDGYWSADRQSLVEWEVEGETLVRADDDRPFHFETTFEAVAPTTANHEHKMNVSTVYQQADGEFEFEVSDPFNVWFNKRFPLDVLGLERRETEMGGAEP